MADAEPTAVDTAETSETRPETTHEQPQQHAGESPEGQPAAEEATPAEKPEADAAASAAEDGAAASPDAAPAAAAEGETAAVPAADEAEKSAKKPKRAKSSSKSPRAASPKTPRAGTPSARRGRSVGASSRKRGATPGTAKKKLAAASAHIPKRALSFGRNLSDLEAADANNTAVAPDGGADVPRNLESELAASPAPLSHSMTESTAANLEASVVVRKPTLRLYGEVAESSEDPKVRASSLFNIAWVYATGTTGVAADLDKAYAYFYHAAQEGHTRARFYMAMLQLNRGLGAAPEFDPESVGGDASPARRGRSASPRRGASPRRARSASPRRGASPGRAGRKKTGPFGGLRRAIENLRLVIDESPEDAEAVALLAQLSDPDMPVPPGYVSPEEAAAAAAAKAKKDAAKKEPEVKSPTTPRRQSSKPAASPTTPAAAAASDAASALPPPLLERTYQAALELYDAAAEKGSVAARMRSEDIRELLAAQENPKAVAATA